MFQVMKTLTTLVSLLLLMISQSAAFSAEASHEKTIHGTVTLSSKLKSKIAPTAALYIIARPNGVTAGPPVAVKRFTTPLKFPVEFSISANDAMMPGTPLEGAFTLMARVSQRGSASPASPGDLQTSKPLNGVKPGGKSVTLEINEERK
jgi:hypothetical protein